MESSRSLRIAVLRTQIILLQKQERNLQSIVTSKFAAPELKEQASIELSQLLKTIRELADEMTGLEAEL